MTNTTTGIDLKKAILALKRDPRDYDFNALLKYLQDTDAKVADLPLILNTILDSFLI